jgi:hypothetical protein
MNQGQFLQSSLKEDFRANFDRELTLGAYVYMWRLFGRAIIQALKDRMLVRILNLGTFRPPELRELKRRIKDGEMTPYMKRKLGLTRIRGKNTVKEYAGQVIAAKDRRPFAGWNVSNEVETVVIKTKEIEIKADENLQVKEQDAYLCPAIEKVSRFKPQRYVSSKSQQTRSYVE